MDLSYLFSFNSVLALGSVLIWGIVRVGILGVLFVPHLEPFLAACPA